MSVSDAWSDAWSDPRLLWGVAVFAAVMLAGTWMLARRARRGRNRAAIACGVVSVGLHVLLICLLPLATRSGGGSVARDAPTPGAMTELRIASFSDAELTDAASNEGERAEEHAAPPLPVSDWIDRITRTDAPVRDSERTTVADDDPLDIPIAAEQPAADPLAEHVTDPVDQLLSELLGSIAEAAAVVEQVANVEENRGDPSPAGGAAGSVEISPEAVAAAATAAGRVVGDRARDFANRRGAARREALLKTGGDDRTEAAVAAGIAWLAALQREDGAWDPRESGAGIERAPLGQHRGGAGARATTGLTGLALLSMLGAGETHHEGRHSQSIRHGLQYLLSVQTPDGSMAGLAATSERTYCHGMAALAICETAAMTADEVATGSARSAVAYTLRAQHPVTGGWRYRIGDRGDLSQLGWQAMVLASGRAAGVSVPDATLERTHAFLRSVRAGRHGGLASYKPGEAPSPTMTAEALATRLLLGERVPQVEIEEAEASLLASPPGRGQDNYYYWYYASLALHQLQDDAWRQWNEQMKARLIATQLPDGSWSTATVWGGNGGKVYTTAMACLCLEVYYRHRTEDSRRTIHR